MLQVELAASIRKDTGKGAMRQLRMKGLTPAVVYGAGSKGLALQLETTLFFKHLLKIYRTNAVVTLKLDDGSTKHVMMQDVQTDPIKDTLLHADFLEIDVNTPRKFEVPVRYVGTAKGVDLGGILHIVKQTLVIEGVPLAVPDEFVVDITQLKIGDSIMVESITVPDDVKLIGKPNQICVNVTVPGKKEGGDKEEA